MMEGKDKVFTVVGGKINMTCRLTSKSATTIAPVSMYYVADPSTESKCRISQNTTPPPNFAPGPDCGVGVCEG